MYNTQQMTTSDKKQLIKAGVIKAKNKPTRGDVCWLVNGIIKEVIHNNIPIKMAYAMKVKLSRMPQYRLGKIVVKPI